MPNAIDLARLLSLKRKIAKDQLHIGDPLEPVAPLALLKDVTWYYGLTGANTLAVTQRWKTAGKSYTDVAFNGILVEPEWTAAYRHAVVHEWAHLFCKHRGDLFILWQRERDAAVHDFDCFINDYQERQCEYVAAFVLVRAEALKMLHGETNSYVARVLDVPVHLVELRWWLLSRFGI